MQYGNVLCCWESGYGERYTKEKGYSEDAPILRPTCCADSCGMFYKSNSTECATSFAPDCYLIMYSKTLVVLRARGG
jgi:hypothetical protein